MQYKYFLILSDLLHKRMSWSELQNMKTTMETLDRLIRLKSVKFRHLKLLNRDNLIKSCDLYNRYTNGKKIPIETIFKDLDWVSQKLESMSKTGTPLNTLITGALGGDLSVIPSLLRGLGGK